MAIVPALLFLATPIVLLFGALFLPAKQGGWRYTLNTVSMAFVMSVFGALGLMGLPDSFYNLLTVRLDVLSALMLVMVTFIGLIILRFSRNYLSGEKRQHYYQRWFLATLAAVSMLVITDNLIILFISWVACSLTLHRLLVFYPERPKAVLAAHKKFILSRVADLCLLAATVMLIAEFQTLSISALLKMDDLSSSYASVAAILIATVAILKCAQLPFHGWLLQVMEAPTPVSALLHAGIVNIGGFLIIRFSPLLAQADFANTLLVIVGTSTAIIASLIMMTRISIKVMLAWSTCAQMGFMLLECGLGAYDLALLHLLAHSLYKAYCFLNAGNTVNEFIRARMAMPPIKPNLPLASVVSVSLFAGFAALLMLTDAWHAGNYGYISLLWIINIALCVILIEGLKQPLALARLMVVPVVVTLALFYALWHQFFADITEAITPPSVVSSTLAAAVMLIFSLFYLLYVNIRVYPYGRLSQWLYPLLYAGLYLDEWFTRQTMRIWPVRLHDFTRNRTDSPSLLAKTGEH
ncbi:NADH-quinone oxidoreductase subunit L [Lacimicrobium alkaliphilum]|uniref:Probable inorganic carbon transporter subunit DabB n=1 Tax=Lacimicrobium alkaliphilum TaxID=1526571 RepID=A0ABQ1RFX0_9ALTE|nr:NADH-quinone oxidoreductase subunit L [Lacimicrobium alkaliphilum]GGD68469.1 NADH dehydrogenase subunit L [Lacimicrobium alkaliphilum]